MRPNQFKDVYGNLNTINLIKGIARNPQGSKFLLLTGPSGHGKSTLAHITSMYALCEQPTAENEPCLQCNSCLGILAEQPKNLVTINSSKVRNIEFVTEFSEMVNSMMGDRNVVILEEFQGLPDNIQAAMLDAIDKSSRDVLIIATTYKAYEVLKALRNRAFQLPVGLSSTDIRLYIENLSGDTLSKNVKNYLMSKRLSPREYEIIIENHILSNKITINDFRNYFQEVPVKSVINFITNFMAPFKQFHIYFAGYSEDDLANLTKSALHHITRSIHSSVFQSGNTANGDHEQKITELISSLTSIDALRLIRYMNLLNESKDKCNDVYTVKFQYERSKNEATVERQLQEQNKQLYTHLEQVNKKIEEVSQKVDKKLEASMNNTIALAGFGKSSFTLNTGGDK